MIELPEAVNLSKQLKEIVIGRKIKKVIAASSPHKFAWYCGNPENYDLLLKGKIISDAYNTGGMVEMCAGNMRIVFCEGVNIRVFEPEAKLPKKHQLLIEFDDGFILTGGIQMYGGLCCFKAGTYDNEYYLVAREKPTPFSNEFKKKYFTQLISDPALEKLSVKALLATEQRIPGLGNGVLQDILFNAKLHPKRKKKTLTASDISILFSAIKLTLKEMVSRGGRDTEKDIFGNPGGYKTKMSKNTNGLPCDECGSTIKKSSYMGGSVYFCPDCQQE